jgi:hypothetical protein
MTANSYPNDPGFRPHDLEPGIKVRNMPPLPDSTVAPLRQAVDSAFPDYHSENDLEFLSRQQPQTPRLLQLCEWHDGMPSSQLPASCIQYTIEWKVTANKKDLSRDTEEDVTMTLSGY